MRCHPLCYSYKYSMIPHKVIIFAINGRLFAPMQFLPDLLSLQRLLQTAENWRLAPKLTVTDYRIQIRPDLLRNMVIRVKSTNKKRDFIIFSLNTTYNLKQSSSINLKLSTNIYPNYSKMWCHRGLSTSPQLLQKFADVIYFLGFRGIQDSP